MNKLLIAGMLLLSNNLMAKDYVLMIGIGEYKMRKLNLSKMEEDIKNYQSILKKLGVTYTNKDILRSKNATKKNIVKRLEDIQKSILQDKKGRIFIFFTGHGLNPDDSNYGNKIDTTLKNKISEGKTGAILPYDFAMDNVNNTIIEGSEIRKILKPIDKYLKQSLIVFDACYSKRSGMNSKNNYPAVYSDIKESPYYPYKNIIYIGASTSLSKENILSPILKRCLPKKSTLNHFKSCMNKELKNKQRASVLYYNNEETLNFF